MTKKCRTNFVKIRDRCVKRSKEVIEAINIRKNMGGLRTADWNKKKDKFTYQIERGKTSGAILRGDIIIVPFWSGGKERFKKIII